MTQPFIIASWPSVPAEIVRAAGFRLVIARGAPGATPNADRHLEPGIFPSRLRHLVDAALSGRLADAACIVIPRTSDADYKCFLYLREFVRRGIAPVLPPVILFDLLQSSAADVRAYNAARTRQLLDQLASVADGKADHVELDHAIARANAARAAARRVVALRRFAPRVSGTDALPVLAAFWEMEPQQYEAVASAAAETLAASAVLSGPRVLLAGAPVDGPELHQAIESHGAIVVAEVGPWGGRAAGTDVALDGDPFRALADHYRANVVGSRTPAPVVRRLIEHMLDEVDAVVVSLPPEDAVFGWDYPWLRDMLQARGMPHVCLRAGQFEPPTPRERGQLDAMVTAATAFQAVRRG